MSGKGSKRAPKKVVKAESESSSSDSEVEKEILEEQNLTDITKKPSSDAPKFETTEQLYDASKQEQVKDIPKEAAAEPKSITDFDHDEIRKIDTGIVKNINTMTLLKILIVRGKDNYNPALWAGTQRLLKNLNCEVERKPDNFPERMQSQPYRGRYQNRGGFSGRGQGMRDSQMNGDRAPQYQPRDYEQHEQRPHVDVVGAENPYETPAGRGGYPRRGGFQRRDDFRGNK